MRYGRTSERRPRAAIKSISRDRFGRCREWPQLQLNTLDPDVAEAVERGAAALFLAGPCFV